MEQHSGVKAPHGLSDGERSALAERPIRRSISWRWITELGDETTEFHRLHGPRVRDLLTTGWISMGLVIVSWIVERWLAGAM